MSTEHPTPITDAAYQSRNGESVYEHLKRKRETMERLETQLAEAMADLSEQDGVLNDLKIELATMQGQRDRLAEALQRIKQDGDKPMSMRVSSPQSIATHALAALDRKEDFTAEELRKEHAAQAEEDRREYENDRMRNISALDP